MDSSQGIPHELATGVPMLKVSSKKIKQVMVRLSQTAITWASTNSGRIDIRQIREIRLGQPPTKTSNRDRWITIVYTRGTQWKVVHLIALTDVTFSLWAHSLEDLVSVNADRVLSQIPATDPDLLFIRQIWPAGAKTITMETACRLCNELGLSVVETDIDSDHHKPLFDLAGFRELVRRLQSRPDLQSLYEKHCTHEEQGVGTRPLVENFLRLHQKEERPHEIFQRFAEDGLWTVQSFGAYLASAHSTWPIPDEDMDHPLCDYFISSSHNTYLVGEQWRGESTVEGYIRVLLAGCRCVEIDCHNGDQEPVVYHGKTLTTHVPIRDVCQAIKQYAFVSSPLPVIISLEIRCSIEQQNVLADVMLDVFENLLIKAPITSKHILPSPAELKNRILIKAKPPQSIPSSRRTMSCNNSGNLDSNDSTSTESDSSFARLARKLSLSIPDSVPFSTKLRDLLVYSVGVKYHGFSKLITYSPNEQFSVSERTANRILKENSADWVKHNFTHLSRVYPKGTRMASSNFDPIPFWRAGCQLVALNWQTCDKAMYVNKALFESCGYVLKPEALRHKSFEPVKRYAVNISIISGHRFPPNDNVFVQVSLDNEVKKTKVVRQKTTNPLWSELMKFQITCRPSDLVTSFVFFDIRGKSFMAQAVKSLELFRHGLHYLNLHDQSLSRYLFATLLVDFRIECIDEE